MATMYGLPGMLRRADSFKKKYAYVLYIVMWEMLPFFDQALYAIFTLFNSHGNQIDRYGEATFGLTVVPYVVMSLLNLFANLVTPSLLEDNPAPSS